MYRSFVRCIHFEDQCFFFINWPLCHCEMTFLIPGNILDFNIYPILAIPGFFKLVLAHIFFHPLI